MAEGSYGARRAQAVRDSVTNNLRGTAGLGSGGAATLAVTAGAGAPTSVVGTVAALAAVTTVGKMARDAFQAVRQQPRDALSTLNNAVQQHAENPSRETYRALGKHGKDFTRVDRAMGSVEAAGAKRNMTVNRVTGMRNRLVGWADRRVANRTDKADRKQERSTRGVNEYLRGGAGSSGSGR